ncbi:MAG: hypothetical protein L0H59_17795 [Tomitella sp.]|nr:hypothetical protein [Tomitella sp.]
MSSTATYPTRHMVAATVAAPGVEGLDWWLSTVEQMQTKNRHRGYPRVDRAVASRRGRGTHVQLRRANGRKQRVLVVDRTDMDRYTGTAAGVWVTTEALSWGRYKGAPRAAGYLLPTLGLVAGLCAAITAATGGAGSNMNVVWSLVAAVLLLPGSVTLLVYRRRRFQDRLWGADIDATERAGIHAARTVLAPGQPRLYKTIAHEWARRLNSLDPDNRFARLDDRFAAHGGHAR